MQKEKESLLRKALKFLAPSLFAIAVMFASFCGLSLVVDAEETQEDYTATITVSNDVWAAEAKYYTVHSVSALSEIVAFNNSEGKTYFTTVNFLRGLDDIVSATYTVHYNSNGNVYKTGVNTYSNAWSYIKHYDSGELSVDCKVFDSVDSATKYATSKDESGILNNETNREYLYSLYFENHTPGTSKYASEEWRLGISNDLPLFLIHDTSEYSGRGYVFYEYDSECNINNTNITLSGSQIMYNEDGSVYKVEKKNGTFNYFIADVISTSIPVFSNMEDAAAFVQTGDDSGQVNKPTVEDVNGDFVLQGFEINNDIVATWTGLKTNIPSVVDEDIFIEVKPTYIVMLESGEEYKNFDGVKKMEIPFLDYKFEYSYDDFFIDNPYKGRCYLYLDFTPIYRESSTLWRRGQTITVSFDLDGNLADYTLPESSLVRQYDESCKLVNPYCNYNSKSDSYYIGWENVVAKHTESEIISSWFLVELVNYNNECVEYSTDYYWGERFLVLSYVELHNFLEANSNQYTPTQIRLTPYYRTATGLYYGNMFFAEIDGRKVTSENESTNDPLSDSVVFEPVGDGDPIFIDGVTPEENTDSDWTFDFEMVFNNFISMINTFLNSAGQIPTLVNKIFGFLPGAYSSMLVTALTIVIILRVIGR